MVTLSKAVRFLRDPAYAAYVIRTRGARLRHRVVRGWFGYAPPPKQVILQITGACNRHCRMCNLWGESGVYRKRDPKTLHAPYEQFERFYNEAYPFRPTIQLMGGEPLIHPDFSRIIEHCRKHPLSIYIPTNGTLLEKYAKILAGPPIDFIEVSLDGPEPIHDSIREEGTFRKAVDGIRAIRDCSGGAGPRIHVRCTIVKENVPHLPELGQVLRDAGVDLLILQHLIYHHPEVHEQNRTVLKETFGMDVSDENGLLPLQGIDGQAVLNSIRALKEAGLPFPIVSNPGYDDDLVLEYYSGGSIREPRKRCMVPDEQLSVDYMGHVCSCNLFMGDAREKGLLAVWNNPRFRRFRKKMDRIHHIPVCKICCYPD